MIARQREHNATQEEFGYWREHPDLAESLVPVWGSAREAIADWHEGDVTGAIGNGILAVTDLAPGAFAIKGLAKGGAKLAGSHTWNATRKWMGKQGMLKKGQHGHHAIIPNSGWGKRVPDKIKNQPWNITGTASPEEHGRIHGKYKGKPRYSPVERYVRGAPNWAKAAHVWPITGSITAADAQSEKKK